MENSVEGLIQSLKDDNKVAAGDQFNYLMLQKMGDALLVKKAEVASQMLKPELSADEAVQ